MVDANLCAFDVCLGLAKLGIIKSMASEDDRAIHSVGDSEYDLG